MESKPVHDAVVDDDEGDLWELRNGQIVDPRGTRMPPVHTSTYKTHVEQGKTTSYKHYFSMEELGLKPTATEEEMRVAFTAKYPPVDVSTTWGWSARGKWEQVKDDEKEKKETLVTARPPS